MNRPSGSPRPGGEAGRPATASGPKALRIVRNHARLFSSALVGAVTFAAHAAVVPAETSLFTSALIGWDVGTLLYLVAAFRLMTRFDLELVRRRAAIQDEGGLVILMLTLLVAVASLGAIVAVMKSISDVDSRTPYFVLAVSTILLSWTFIHVIFALHYAHEYYDERDEGGLLFPEEDRPDYWDFVYFSFVIGMTFQVSDVQVTDRAIRRLVVVHGLVSFIFNVAILALVVNLGAGLIGSPPGGEPGG